MGKPALSSPLYQWVSIATSEGELKLLTPKSYVDHCIRCHLSGQSVHQFLRDLVALVARGQIGLEDLDDWVKAILAAFPE